MVPAAKMSAGAVPTPVAEIVTRAELVELADLEEAYASAKKEVSEIERSIDAARLSLAQKVLGVKTRDEWKLLDPETQDRLMLVRSERGFWKLARGAPAFAFVKSWEGRRPSWRDEFISISSEAQAEQITADTPKTYSYMVDVAL